VFLRVDIIVFIAFLEYQGLNLDVQHQKMISLVLENLLGKRIMR